MSMRKCVLVSTYRVDFNQQNPVDETHFSWPWCHWHGSGRVCLVTRHTLSLRGPSPQVLTLLGGVRFIAWCLRLPFLGECRQGPKHFGECRTHLCYSPAPRNTLKKALCHTCPDGRTANKYHWYLHIHLCMWKYIYNIYIYIYIYIFT